MSGLLEAMYNALGGGEAQPPSTQSSRPSTAQSPVQAEEPQIVYPGNDLPRRSHASPPLPPTEMIDDVAPIDLAKDTPAHPADTSISTAADTSIAVSSVYSSPAEILFGPQSTPFIYRKRERALTNEVSRETPSKVVFLPGQHQRNSSMPVIASEAVSPDNKENRLPPPPVISPNRPFNMLMNHIKASQVTKPGQKRCLSAWRIEQLGRLPAAKITNDRDIKPIPVLHGPLSLPYARNPSGVDAVVADESAYLSNVFGIRAAADLQQAEERATTLQNRVPSFDTNTTRSTSGSSSVFSNDNVNVSIATNSSTTSSKLERDPYQYIGIKKANAENLDSKHVKISTAAAVPPTSTIISRLHKSTSQTPSSILKAQLANSIANNLATIPGSPAAEASQDAFQPLFESAIKAAEDAKRTDPSLAQPIHESPGTLASQMIIKDLAQYLNSQLASPNPPRLDLGDIIARVQLAEQLKTLGPPTRSSKADASGNWRKREMSAGGAPTSPSLQFGARRVSGASSVSDGPIMTIDALFEKFGQMSMKPTAATSVFKPATPAAISPTTPEDPAIKQKSDKPLEPTAKVVVPLGAAKRVPVPTLPATPATDSDKQKPSLSGATVKPSAKPSTEEKSSKSVSPSNAASPAKTKSKGTPGAGKLLKKGKTPTSKLAIAVNAASVPLPSASEASSV